MKDKEVTVKFLLKNQRKINGHLSMFLKTFMVGRATTTMNASATSN